MTWTQFHQRQEAIRAVLDHARANPAAEIDLAAVPAAAEVFTSRDEVLRALHYKWMRSLVGRVDVGVEDADADPRGDRVEAVTKAWRRTAADNPVLRQVLDAHADDPALAEGALREQRMLALSAGLSEADEPLEEINRVGKAFMGLVRSSTPSRPDRRTRRRRPLAQLRRLIPSR